MPTVTKKELIDRIAVQEECKRPLVKRIIQNFLRTIVTEIGEGNRIELRDFGVFEGRIRASRDAQNPRTMNKVRVPPKRTVKFKPGRELKSLLSKSPPPVDAATGLAIESSASTVRRPAARREAAVPR